MPAFTARRFILLSSIASLAVAVACSSSSDDAASPDGGAPPGPAPAPMVDSGAPSSDAQVAFDVTSILQPVTFSYTPSWKGVTTVEVLGAFGQSTDWKTPYLTLKDDGTGKWTGVSAPLAAGHYIYVFHIVGDEAAAMPAKFDRYAIDPTRAALIACPADSPTFGKNAVQPCIDLTVPVPAAEPAFHARGKVVSGGAPIADYLVEISRVEKTFHGTFVDRFTVPANGKFDFPLVGGHYKFAVLHPTYYSMTDAQRTDPESLAAVRQTSSSTLLLAADTDLTPAEVSFSDYASMQPRGSTTLPTTFAFTVPPKAKAEALVYAPGSETGDPLWSSSYAKTPSAVFDGGGLSNKKGDVQLDPDAGYWWGTQEQFDSADDGGVSWTAQSMVFPVQWP